MKQILLIAITVLTVTFAQAQLNYGVKAGLNLNNMNHSYKVADSEPETQMAIGFHIGLAVDYELADNIALQSGLLFTTKGAKMDSEDSGEGYKTTTTGSASYNYLEIPIHFAYKMNALQIYAGPYVAFGMGGKFNSDSETVFESDLLDDSTSSFEGDFKSVFGEYEASDLEEGESAVNGLDYGVDFGLGYMAMDNLLVNAGYSYGLGNTMAKYKGDDNYGDNKDSHSVISISATYFFGN